MSNKRSFSSNLTNLPSFSVRISSGVVCGGSLCPKCAGKPANGLHRRADVVAEIDKKIVAVIARKERMVLLLMIRMY